MNGFPVGIDLAKRYKVAFPAGNALSCVHKVTFPGGNALLGVHKVIFPGGNALAEMYKVTFPAGKCPFGKEQSMDSYPRQFELHPFFIAFLSIQQNCIIFASVIFKMLRT